MGCLIEGQASLADVAVASQDERAVLAEREQPSPILPMRMHRTSRCGRHLLLIIFLFVLTFRRGPQDCQRHAHVGLRSAGVDACVSPSLSCLGPGLHSVILTTRPLHRLKKPSKKERKEVKRKPVERMDVRTVGGSGLGRQKAQKRRSVIGCASSMSTFTVNVY